jgi:hypothetical protein
VECRRRFDLYPKLVGAMKVSHLHEMQPAGTARYFFEIKFEWRRLFHQCMYLCLCERGGEQAHTWSVVQNLCIPCRHQESVLYMGYKERHVYMYLITDKLYFLYIYEICFVGI